MRRLTLRRLPILGVSIAAFIPSVNHAANFTWLDTNNGTVNWSTGLWNPSAPVSGLTTDLTFLGSGTGSYTAVNNIATPFSLNTLTLNSSSTGAVSISGGQLDFQVDDTNAAILQNGSGAFTISNELAITNDVSFGGTGAGAVTLSGIISGFGALNFNAGNWRITNALNTFSGPLTIFTGAAVEVTSLSAPPQSINITTAGASYLGNFAPLTLNGGTLKLTTTGAGNISFGTARPITFDLAGGVLDLRNQNLVSPTVQGGNIAGGDLAVSLNNDPTSPAVIKFNGGQLGLQTNNATDGNWGTGGNALRISSYLGGGPLRIEVTNGATFRLGTGAGANQTISQPITLRGVVGGEPTSGPAGIINSGISLSTGRIAIDNAPEHTYSNSLTLEGALQFIVVGTTRALNGNIIVAGTAGGNPGYVAFSGRGTGTQLSSTVNAPNAGGAGQNPLWLLRNQNGTLTIQDGGIALFDPRIRSDTGGRNGNGVALDGPATIEPGGLLRIQQSLSNFTPGVASTIANVGDILIYGDIIGTGNTTKDAVFSILLPRPEAGSPVATTIPAALTATATVDSERPYGGLVFDDSRGVADFIINGTGFGGLRIESGSRPNALLQGAIADPVPSTTKLSSVLTATRLSRLSGTGGYLTPAPGGATYSFPTGGEWALNQPIGLKVVDHNNSGADVSLSALTTFSHNVAVDTGATLDLGANPFVFAAGNVHGLGSILSTGGVTIGAAAGVSPGLGATGTITIGANLTLSGTYLAEVASATSDLLAVMGNLTLGGTLSLSGTFGTNTLTIASYSGSLTGTFAGISGLSPDFTIDYGTGANSTIKLLYTPSSERKWNGNVSGAWNKTTANWQGGSTFSDGNKVTFDDTAAGPNLSVTVTGGDVSPSLITVNNITKAYTLTSSPGSAIIGPAQLIKNGAGILTLSGPATYSGGTTINAGQVRLGSDNAIPDFGAVTIATGATLNTQGHSDTIGNLSVDGSVTGAGSLTVGSLTLGSGVTFVSSVTLNGTLTKTGLPTSIVGNVDLGGSDRTLSVATSSSPELTIGGVISNGGLTKAGDGTLYVSGANTYSAGTTVTGGTLVLGAATSLPTGSNLTVGAGATLETSDFSVDIGSLSGAGNINLGNGNLTTTSAANTTFGGTINGITSVVTKAGTGSLTLGGSNSFGGLNINAGTIVATNNSAAGFGPISVNAGATLVAGASLGNQITLSGATLGTQGNPGTITSNELRIADGTTATIYMANPANLGVNSEAILTGTLLGSGNINVLAGTNNPSPDAGPGFRLRGGGVSDYSGTITAGPSVKLEIQVSDSFSPNPMGTGKIVMTAGTRLGNLQGTYSQFQPRITGGTAAVMLGNDMEIAGTGYVNINVLGAADVTAVMGNLKIGAGQILGVNKNDTSIRTLAFPTVTLTGGNAEFRLFDPGFTNSATPGGAHLRLGEISESAAGSGLILRGQAPYETTFEQPNLYTGTTTIESGTVRTAAVAALPATTALTINGGTLDISSNFVGYNQTVARLAGLGGLITNTAFGSPATLTINQSDSTTFGGFFGGELGITKAGTGALVLTGFSEHLGSTTIQEGTLSVNGSLGASSVAAVINGTLQGTGIAAAVNIGDGIGGIKTALLAPGTNGTIGTFKTANTTFANSDAGFDLELNTDTLATDLLEVTGTLTLGLGIAQFDGINLGSALLSNNEIFTIATATGGVTGFFNGLPENSSFFLGANQFSIHYNPNSITLVNIPEPSALTAAACGLAMIAGLGRRRVKAVIRG